jgi:hypothetical protein
MNTFEEKIINVLIIGILIAIGIVLINKFITL